MWLLENHDAFGGTFSLPPPPFRRDDDDGGCSQANLRLQTDGVGSGRARNTWSGERRRKVSNGRSPTAPCPGQTQLADPLAFGAAGQLAMSHSTISRKHLTITVLSPADAEDPSSQLASRSRLAIADLATKLGTVVNGHQLKGSSIVVDDPLVEIYMGKCPSPFRYLSRRRPAKRR